MYFYQILNEIMDEQNIGIAEVARKCNLTDSTVRSIIDRKQKKIALSVAFKLSNGLGISLERLNGMPEKEIEVSTLLPNEMSHIQKYRTLDPYGQAAVTAILDCEYNRCVDERRDNHTKVVEIFPTRHYLQPASAGYGDFNDDNSYEIIDLVKRPPNGTSFIITVHGDSMEPTYKDGDFLFIRLQNQLNVGDIGMVSIGADTFVKELGPDGLISHNPNYDPPEAFEDTPVTIQGKVIGLCTNDYLR